MAQTCHREDHSEYAEQLVCLQWNTRWQSENVVLQPPLAFARARTTTVHVDHGDPRASPEERLAVPEAHAFRASKGTPGAQQLLLLCRPSWHINQPLTRKRMRGADNGHTDDEYVRVPSQRPSAVCAPCARTYTTLCVSTRLFLGDEHIHVVHVRGNHPTCCLLYTSPSPRD